MNTSAVTRRFRQLFVGVALSLGALSASAISYSSLVVFGDSLSDPGNAYAMTGGYFPPAPYEKTFSNGPTAAEYLASNLGLSIQNYAVGGAMTNNQNYLALTMPALAPALGNTGISAQIANWNPVGTDTSSALFMVWGGANDFSYSFELAGAGLAVDFSAVVATAVTNVANDIYALSLKGAQNFFVPYLPDLGLTPRAAANGAGFAALASSMSHGYNTGLATAIGNLHSSFGLNITSFDTAQYMANIISSPPAGLTDVSSYCLAGGAPALAADCAGYLFFDDIHPTTYAHELIGEAFAQAVPEPAPVIMMLLGLGALALRSRRTRHAH